VSESGAHPIMTRPKPGEAKRSPSCLGCARLIRSSGLHCYDVEPSGSAAIGTQGDDVQHDGNVEPVADTWPASPDVVRQQVSSVVSSVVHAGELDECSVVWLAPDQEPRADFTRQNFPASDATRDGPPNLWVRVVAQDEEWWYGTWHPSGMDWQDFLPAFADELEGWVSETSFAWGERRLASLPEGMSRPE
jgi:hypothetical protein